MKVTSLPDRPLHQSADHRLVLRESGASQQSHFGEFPMPEGRGGPIPRYRNGRDARRHPPRVVSSRIALMQHVASARSARSTCASVNPPFAVKSNGGVNKSGSGRMELPDGAEGHEGEE